MNHFELWSKPHFENPKNILISGVRYKIWTESFWICSEPYFQKPFWVWSTPYFENPTQLVPIITVIILYNFDTNDIFWLQSTPGLGQYMTIRIAVHSATVVFIFSVRLQQCQRRNYCSLWKLSLLYNHTLFWFLIFFIFCFNTEKLELEVFSGLFIKLIYMPAKSR